jgi:DNA-binding transcriptional MocR family regulator
MQGIAEQGIAERAKALAAEGKSHRQIAEALGCAKSTVQKHLAKSNAAAPKPQAKSVAEKPAAGRSLDDFRKAHDQSYKIRDGIKRMFAGGAYMTDAEFREAVGGNPSRWRVAADASEFAHNRYRVQGELLWASEKTIREMRRIRGEAV